MPTVCLKAIYNTVSYLNSFLLFASQTKARQERFGFMISGRCEHENAGAAGKEGLFCEGIHCTRRQAFQGHQALVKVCGEDRLETTCKESLRPSMQLDAAWNPV